MLWLLLRRRAAALRNTVRSYTPYEAARNAAFALAGVGLLVGLHVGFMRMLGYLATVPLLGPLLLWKLTAMTLLTTFTMVGISSLLTSLTTLYYSYDLEFLMNAPLTMRTIFVEKSLESLFYASWMIGLVLVPYVAALVRVQGYGIGFFAAFVGLSVPFLALGAAIGIAFTLMLLYFFPSSRTRDAVWVLSSLSLTVVYGLARFAEPERLIRPDALRVVSEYLNYLQAPTAPYLPSWWLTRALRSFAAGRRADFWAMAAALTTAFAAVYAILVWASGRVYFAGYSGARESTLRRRRVSVERLPERWLGKLAPLFWKDRTTFFRDVKHWSQILLVMGLIFVYLYSIRRLPLDSPDLRSMVSFMNVATAGFVLAALGLRFTYPSISLEGKSWWVLKAAPLGLGSVMREKFLFSALPMTALALVLGLTTNRILDADRFTSWVSIVSLLVITWALCAMGVGFGALFPLFNVENIHQVESSLGGFVYMAAALGYIGATVTILSWPMHMHFQERFGKVGAWNWPAAWAALGLWLALNTAAFIVPWRLGRRSLERYEH